MKDSSNPNRKKVYLVSKKRIVSLVVVILLWILTGCMPLDLFQIPDTSTKTPTGTIVSLPPTWTDLPVTVTHEPTRTSLASYTPTTTDTPLPSTTPILSSSVTQDPTETHDPQATITPLYHPDSLPDCIYTAVEPGVEILPAPFIDIFRANPTMVPHKPYPAVIDKPTYSLLLDNGEPIGWVDYRLMALNMDGNDCLTRRDNREITDFSTLCFFTPYEELEAYLDPDNKELSHTLFPDQSYILLLEYSYGYFSAFGHAGPSFYVDKDSVFTHGSCSTVPSAGISKAETNLFSLPPHEGGEIIAVIPIDQPVYIQTQSKPGPPPSGVEEDGTWVLIKVRTSEGYLVGWGWFPDFQYQ